MNKIKIVIYNNFNIGDTFFAQPFARNIVENNKDTFDFYFLCKFNTCAYTDTIPEIKNVIEYPELLEDFKIYNKDCNIEFYGPVCPHNFMIHHYIPNKRILFINTWIGNFIKDINTNPYILNLYKDNNFEEMNVVSYIKYYQNTLNDIYNKYNIRINYNPNDKILLPIFPKLDSMIINKFINFKKQFNKKFVYLINYPGCSKQPLSFKSITDFIHIINILIQKNYIVLLPNKDSELLSYKLNNNINDMYFMTDEFNLTIDNSCRNLYYCTKFGNMCDITISFDTGRNYLYMNDDFINNQNNNKKYHFGSWDKFYNNLLNNKLLAPFNYVTFIKAITYRDIVNYIDINL
jgi:hypothetical protein